LADRVLLLGAAGTVGSRVALALRESGFDVRCLCRTPGTRNALQAQAADCQILWGDYNETATLQSALAGCRFLMHCAAPYPSSGLRFRRAGMLARWVPQLQAVLKLARAAGIERVVFTSSLSTIGMAPAGQSADESLPYNPRRQGGGNYYPVKHALEQAVLQGAAEFPPAVIVNPTGLVGEGSRNPELSGACVFFGGLTPFMVNARLNFVDTHDCAKGHVLALQRGVPGQRYILGGVNTTLKEFADTVTTMAGISRPIVLPRPLAKLGGYWGELRGLATGKTSAMSLTSYYHLAYGQHYSSAKAQRDLGYVPTTDLHNAIERELRWHGAKAS